MIYSLEHFICYIFIFGLSNVLFFYSIFVIIQFKSEIDDDDINDTLQEIELEEKIIIPYEKKYLQEYKNLVKNANIKNANIKNTENATNANAANEEELKKRNFKNSFLMEKTPLGNVALYYNQDRECFEYYSDHTIPYRYLETIGRKYVITFDCIDLYIDMEEELQKQKEIIENQNAQIKENQNPTANPTANPSQNTRKNEVEETSKKNVFAKLKNYNKSSNPVQPNRSNHEQNHTQKQEPNIPSNPLKKPNHVLYPSSASSKQSFILKEKSNSYLCKGRFSNFNLLQPIKKEVVDKNYNMSFKDFKQRAIK